MDKDYTVLFTVTAESKADAIEAVRRAVESAGLQTSGIDAFGFGEMTIRKVRPYRHRLRVEEKKRGK